jgi:hypothetical protein
LLGQAIGPVHLVLACPEDHSDDPWLLARDALTDLSTASRLCLAVRHRRNLSR